MSLCVCVQVVALVMDVFTDVDLLCDLMEASNKRRVPVYILLDDKNLHYFADMCSMLDIQNTNLSVSTQQPEQDRIAHNTVKHHYRV